MTQRQKKMQKTLSEFDKIVQAAQREVQKSLVVSPSDPNGGAKLPRRQSGAATRKIKGKEQYAAIFDRDAQHSDDQLEDWETATQATTQSPSDFVNDEDDAPEDYDSQQWEDNRRADESGNGVYDPYGDDDDLDEDDLDSLDLPDDDEEYVTVKRHKRRKMRKSVDDDHDEDYPDLSDDDDDLDEDDDDSDEDDDKLKKRKKVKKSIRKSRKLDDDEPEDDDADDEEDDVEDEEEAEYDEPGDDEKSVRRRRKMKKALGVDAMALVDGNKFVKSLTEAIFDMQDQHLAELRVLQREVQKLRKQVHHENRQMAKSLATGMAQAALPMDSGMVVPTLRNAQPLRKGYGLPVQTAQRGVQGFDVERALDTLEDALQKGLEGVSTRDITILENDRVPDALSPTAQNILRKARVL